MSLLQKIRTRFRKKLFKPSTPCTSGKVVSRLGSEYGGWCYWNTPQLENSTVVLCGAGEDISFDLEMVRKFGCRTIIVDPTPRAITHVNEVLRALDSNEGHCGAYNLNGIDHSQLTLLEKAVWNRAEVLKFYLPKDPNHVSHSIINFQNNYAKDTEAISVDAMTLADICSQLEISEISLLKLDIEGAEIEVIADMLQTGIQPDQVLVEFDEINCPSKRSKERVESTYSALITAGYDLLHIEDGCNYTFVAKRLLGEEA